MFKKRVIFFVVVAACLMTSPAAAQYIHLYRNEQGEVEEVTYVGDADWLVAQKDPKSQLHKMPRLTSLDLLQHDISFAEMEYVTKLTRLQYLRVGEAPEVVAIDVKALSLVSRLKGLEEFHLCKQNLADDDLKFLPKMKNLKYLLIVDMHLREDTREHGLTDGVAKHIAATKSLVDVELRCWAEISDDFIIELSALRELRALSVSSKRFNDKTLDTIGTRLRLEHIDISSPHLTDEGVRLLCRMSALEEVKIDSPRLTARAIESLQGLKKLRELDLTINRLEDSSISRIASMKFLERLIIRRVQLTDNDLVGLKDHPSLKCLIFDGSKLTDHSLETFKTMKNLEYVILGTTPKMQKLDKAVDELVEARKRGTR